MSPGQLPIGLPPVIIHVAMRCDVPVGVGSTPAEACEAAAARGIRSVDRIARYAADDPTLTHARHAAQWHGWTSDLDILRMRIASLEALCADDVLGDDADPADVAELERLRAELHAEEYRAAHPSLWPDVLHTGNPASWGAP